MKFTVWFRDNVMCTCSTRHELELYLNDARGGKHLQTTISIDDADGHQIRFCGSEALYMYLDLVNTDTVPSEATPDVDISVSDRMPLTDAWRNYKQQLGQTIGAVAALLSDTGQVLITFNNHDVRAWGALLMATQAAGLVCSQAKYQLPAVVSSKAAFHPGGSYIGDLWAVLGKGTERSAPSRGLQPAIDALRVAAAFRGGTAPAKLLRRTLALAWLTHNLDAALIGTWDELLESLFEQATPHKLRLRGPMPTDVPRFEPYVREVVARHLQTGPCSWGSLYAVVAERCAAFGVPEAAEVRALLADELVTKGQRILGLRGLDQAQETLA